MGISSGTSQFGLQTLYTSSSPEILGTFQLLFDPTTIPGGIFKLGTVAILQANSYYDTGQYMDVFNFMIRGSGLMRRFYLLEGGNKFYNWGVAQTWQVQANWRQPGIAWTCSLGPS